MIIAIITTPPNYLYQRWLEDTFPARPAPRRQKQKTDEKPEETQLSMSNTITKFCLDQSIGAAANTVAFIILASLLNGKSLVQAGNEVEKVCACFLTRSSDKLTIPHIELHVHVDCRMEDVANGHAAQSCGDTI